MVDLAPGSVAALAGCVAIGTYLATDSILLAILSAVLIGAATGVTEVASLSLISCSFVYHDLGNDDGRSQAGFHLHARAFPSTISARLAIWEKGDLLGVPIPVLVMLALAVFSAVLLSKTRFGRYLYAIGGSEMPPSRPASRSAASRCCLCHVRRFLGHRWPSPDGAPELRQPAAGVGYEFDAITGAIIGGTSFTGGVGTISGTLAGCLIVGVINNVLNLLSVPSYYQQVVKGVIIVVAVVFDLRTRGVRSRKI